MDITIILIAIALAIDSFSASITRGFAINKPTLLFEALKTGFDNWIAFGLLFFIGLRMIYESLSREAKQVVSSSSFKVLLILSVATSIDALAVGLSLSFIETSIIVPAIIFGITTFSFSFFGVFIGKKSGNYFEKIGVLGGVILIVIGIRILIEHLGIIV